MTRTSAFLSWILLVLWGIAVVAVSQQRLHAPVDSETSALVVTFDGLRDGDEEAPAPKLPSSACDHDKYDDLLGHDFALVFPIPALSVAERDETLAGALPGNAFRHEEPPRSTLISA